MSRKTAKRESHRLNGQPSRCGLKCKRCGVAAEAVQCYVDDAQKQGISLSKHLFHANFVCPSCMMPPTVVTPPLVPLRLDLGCGPSKRSDKPFTGVDAIAFPGVDVVHDLTVGSWPWDDNSVEEIHASHFLEHLTNWEGKWQRTRFFNEAYRVLRPGGQMTLIFPHWCSTRYYGDPTHREPFSEMGFYYLSREWRLGDAAKGLGANAPHSDIAHNPNGYSCDFEASWGNLLRPEWTVRSQEASQFAQTWYKEVIQDLQAVLTKRV